MGSEESESTVNKSGKEMMIEEGQSSERSTNNNNAAPATDWRKLFSATVDQTLNFYPPKRTDGKLIVPPEIIAEGERQWRNAVVVQFLGKIPNFSFFQRMINVLWGKEGDVDLRPVGHNLFVVQLPNLEMRDKVLESGPWHIQNKPIIVRKWEPGMKYLEFNMTKLPIWIQMNNVPLELFTQKGISHIASVLGKPLYMDSFTAKQQRLAYAKVCVEVEATMEIPSHIEVELRNGKSVTVHVEVPWMPAKCTQCGIFGHCDKTCPRKPVEHSTAKIWVPKAQTAPENEGGNCARTGNREEEKKEEEKKGVEKKKDKEDQSQGSAKAGSLNRYAILNSMSEENDLTATDMGEQRKDDSVVETRKVRGAAAGVAELMKTLKPRKKGPIDKGKKGTAGSTASRGFESIKGKKW